MTVAKLRDYLGRLSRLRAELERYHGVWDIDIGYRLSGGALTGELAARLFVVGPKLKASDRSKYRLAPKSLGGLPIDIISLQFEPHAGKSPLPKRVNMRAGVVGGISIGTKDDAPGTLGAVFRSSKHGGLVGLTSSHLAPDESEHVFAPSPVDRPGGVDLGEVIAIDYEYGASLFRVSAPGVSVGALMDLPKISGFMYEEELHEAAIDQMPVVKSGRTTGVTRARITGLSASGTITLTAEDGGGEIARGGDSGSLWVTKGGRAVGLHFAGGVSGGCGWAQAMPMHGIVKNLGLSIE